MLLAMAEEINLAPAQIRTRAVDNVSSRLTNTLKLSESSGALT